MNILDISVVLPVYNAQEYLKVCISSILNSSFHNFELIIVNDGSTDDSEAIIDSFSDNRIIKLNQKNCGIGIALRNGCLRARGKYIARMDADDIMHKRRLEYQFDFFQKNKSFVLLGTSVEYIDEHDRVIGLSYPYTWNFILKYILRFGSPFTHPTVMFRRDAYIKSGGYIDNGPIEDFYLWNKLKPYGKFSQTEKVLLKYRINSKNISSSHSFEESETLKKYVQKELKNIYIKEFDIIGFKDLKNKIKNKYEENNFTSYRLSLLKEHILISSFNLNKLRIPYIFLKNIIGLRFIFLNFMLNKNS
jgi:glycosyltransferase involved in cell wall biosynthesis